MELQLLIHLDADEIGMHHQLANAGIQALKVTKKANRREIPGFASTKDWAKFIASIFKKQGYDYEEAKDLSRRIIRSRTRAIGFVRSGFIKMVGGMGGRSRGKKHRNTVALIVKAKPGKMPFAQFLIQWGARDGDNGRGLEKIVNLKYMLGLRAATKDMVAFYTKNAVRISKRHSG